MFPNNLHIVILRNFFLTLDAMVLDEPTATLDKESIARLMNCLQERKMIRLLLWFHMIRMFWLNAMLY